MEVPLLDQLVSTSPERDTTYFVAPANALAMLPAGPLSEY
jgi:hypothetical protein